MSIPNLEPIFHIHIKIENVRVNTGRWYQLFQVSKVGTKKFDYGERISSLFFNYENGPYFHPTTDRNGIYNQYVNTRKLVRTSRENGYDVFKGPFIIDFSQKLNEKYQYVTKITFNGETLVETVNNDPIHGAAKILLSSPGYEALNCDISEFILETGGSGNFEPIL